MVQAIHRELLHLSGELEPADYLKVLKSNKDLAPMFWSIPFGDEFDAIRSKRNKQVEIVLELIVDKQLDLNMILRSGEVHFNFSLILYYMQEMLSHGEGSSTVSPAVNCMFDVVLPHIGSNRFNDDSLTPINYKLLKAQLNQMMKLEDLFQNHEYNLKGYSVFNELVTSDTLLGSIFDEGQRAYMLLRLYDDYDSFMVSMKSLNSTGDFSDHEKHVLQSMFKGESSMR